MNWYFAVLKRYGDFSSRAHRMEFWAFFAVNALMVWVMGQVGHVVGINAAQAGYALVVLLPALAVGTRRLHDTGLSGWWLLAGLVPFAGIFVLVFLMAREGTPGDNRYGPPPAQDLPA